MDDGSEGKFGTEIELRGQFEACACVADPAAGISIAKQMEKRLDSDSEALGWEGVKFEKPRNPDAKDADASHVGATHGDAAPEKTQTGEEKEKSLAICLCVEGGPGTIGTVQVFPPGPPPASHPAILRLWTAGVRRQPYPGSHSAGPPVRPPLPSRSRRRRRKSLFHPLASCQSLNHAGGGGGRFGGRAPGGRRT